MKFKAVCDCKTSIKKKPEYDFNFTEEQKEKGLSATYENPYWCKLKPDSLLWYGLYNEKGKLEFLMVLHFKVFKEP